MAELDVFPVQLRSASGKGAARALRREGKVPAVLYGGDRPPANLAIDARTLVRELQRGGFTSKLFELVVEDRRQRVLPKDVQLHPVTDRPLHVDFQRIAEDAEIVIMVPVRFLNEEECDGLRQGGVLNVVRHEVELKVSANAIPDLIDADLAGIKLGEGIHISDIKLPDGAVPTITDRDFTIATIVAPTIAEVEEEEETEEIEELEEAAPEETEE